jgi:hypothetical protein
VWRLAVFALLVLGGLYYVHSHHVIHNAHLLGTCRTVLRVQAPPSNSEWRECKPGFMGGPPNLSGKDCGEMDTVGDLKYWSCPISTVPTN